MSVPASTARLALEFRLATKALELGASPASATSASPPDSRFPYGHTHK